MFHPGHPVTENAADNRNSVTAVARANGKQSYFSAVFHAHRLPCIYKQVCIDAGDDSDSLHAYISLQDATTQTELSCKGDFVRSFLFTCKMQSQLTNK